MALTPTLSLRERGQDRIVLRAQPPLFCLLSTGIQPGQRHIAVGLIDVADDARSPPLLNEPHALPDEHRGAEGIVLGHPSAQGVVVEAGALGAFVFRSRSARGTDLDQAVFFIPGEALRGVPATELSDQAAMAVIEEALVFKHPHQVVFDVARLRVLGAALQRCLAGVVEDVAGRVVLEGFAGGVGDAGPADRASQRLARAALDAAGGVVGVGGVAFVAVAALAQLAHLVIGVGLHEAVQGTGVLCTGAEDGLLPVAVLGAEGLGAQAG